MKNFRLTLITENQNSIELTDRICSPWIVNFDRIENEVELIFNKSELTNYQKENFNTLNWANFGIEK